MKGGKSENKEKGMKVLINWLAIYPLITLVLFVFGPLLNPIPLALRTFVITIVIVPVMVYVAVPLLEKVVVSIIGRLFQKPERKKNAYEKGKF